MARKTNDTDKMLDELLSEEEVLIPQLEKENFTLEPLLEEIEQIKDVNVQSFVRSVLLKSVLFWEIPAVFSEEYNPPDEHDIGGNVLHTKRVFRICTILTESYMLSEIDRDLVYAAALLHSVTKGVLIDGNPNYDDFYPYTVDRFVHEVMRTDQLNANENESSVLHMQEEHVRKILRIIRCHRGPWSPIPETFPIDDIEMIVHLADHIASKLHVIIDGDEPIPQRWDFIAR